MSTETNDKVEPKPAAKSAAKSTQIAVRLVPANDSDRPVLANYVSLQPASGMLLLDFVRYGEDYDEGDFPMRDRQWGQWGAMGNGEMVGKWGQAWYIA